MTFEDDWCSIVTNAGTPLRVSPIRLLRRFFGARSGQMVAIFALVAPFIVMLVTFGLDYARFENAERRIMRVTDAAALSAALMTGQSRVPVDVLTKRVETVVRSHYASDARLSFDVEVNGHEPPYTVGVVVSHHLEPMFKNVFFPSVVTVSHIASAEVAEMGPICVLALGDDSPFGVRLRHRTSVFAPNCGVQSNFDDPDISLEMGPNTQLAASFINLVGNVTTHHATPAPRTEEARVADPLESKANWPVAGGCDFVDLRLSTGTHTMTPGTYCGLRITGDASVTFQPGIYIIKNSQFLAGSKASLFGREVGFFLTGQRAKLRIKDAATLDFTPPASGPMTDIFIARASGDIPRDKHQQLGGRGPSRFEGMVYLPHTRLHVNAVLESGFTPDTLLFVADGVDFYGNRNEFHLAANGEAGFVSVNARVVR